MPRTTLLLVLALVTVAPGVANDRPNVVFFLVDDLGWADLGCYGSTLHETPHIDRLAASGMRFTDAHAPGAVCHPSRYGLLTGRYPARTRFAVGRRAAIAQSLSARRWRGGLSRLSNSRSRQCRSILGSGMRMGHTASHRPQNVEALGRCPAWSTPMSEGVSTEPIAMTRASPMGE